MNVYQTNLPVWWFEDCQSDLKLIKSQCCLWFHLKCCKYLTSYFLNWNESNQKIASKSIKVVFSSTQLFLTPRQWRTTWLTILNNTWWTEIWDSVLFGGRKVTWRVMGSKRKRQKSSQRSYRQLKCGSAGPGNVDLNPTEVPELVSRTNRRD